MRSSVHVHILNYEVHILYAGPDAQAHSLQFPSSASSLQWSFLMPSVHNRLCVKSTWSEDRNMPINGINGVLERALKNESDI